MTESIFRKNLFDVYFDLILPMSHPLTWRKRALWTILQPATRERSRCFVFTFGELSCHPSLYTVYGLTFLAWPLTTSIFSSAPGSTHLRNHLNIYPSTNYCPSQHSGNWGHWQYGPNLKSLSFAYQTMNVCNVKINCYIHLHTVVCTVSPCESYVDSVLDILQIFQS